MNQLKKGGKDLIITKIISKVRTALKLCKSEGIIVCEHPMYEKLKLDVINYKVKQYKDKFITFCTKK